MQVWFGKYNGRTNSANKTYNWEVEMRFNDLEPYGKFNPYAPVFALQEFRNVNYCWYKYGDITFYGYVEVSTHTNGLYLYTVTIDPLTTAYNNGCMDVDAYIEYADASRLQITTLPYGNMLDERVRYSPIPVVKRYNLENGSGKSDYVLLTVGDLNMGSEYAPSNDFTVPSAGVYIMDYNAYWNICKDLRDSFWDPEHQTAMSDKARDSIINNFMKLYAIPDTFYNKLTTNGTQTNGVYVQAMERKELAGIYGKYEIQTFYLLATHTAGDLAECYALPMNGSTDVFAANVEIPNNEKIDAQFASYLLQIPFCGQITFSPVDIGVTDVKSVGYVKSYDVINCLVRATLVVNGVLYEDYAAQGCFGTVLTPFTTNDSSNSIGNNTALSNSTVGALTAVGGDKLSSIAMSSPGVAVAKFASDLMGSFNRRSSPSMSIGSSNILDSWDNRKGFVRITYYKQVGRDNIRSVYGQPFGTVLNLRSGNFSAQGHNGYVQTRDVHLKTNNLPLNIINQAEAILNSGAYIGNVPQ